MPDIKLSRIKFGKFKFKKRHGKKRATVAQRQNIILRGITAGLTALAIFVVGVVAVQSNFSIKNFLMPTQGTTEFQDYVNSDYIDKANFLFLDVADSGSAVRCAMLIKVNMETDSLLVTSLPTDMMIGNRTLQEIYSSDGIAVLNDSMQENMGISIDRYISFKDAKFKKFVDKTGIIKYNFAEKIKFSTSGEDAFIVRIKEGEQKLNGEQMIQLFRYCGEGIKDYKLQNEIVTAAINQILNMENYENGESLFKTMFNFVQTNMSVSDFTDSKDVLAYLCQDEYSLTTSFLNTTGEQTPSGFVADETMLREIKVQFYKEL